MTDPTMPASGEIQIFGLSLSDIRKMIYVYQTKNIDPYELARLRRRNFDLSRQVDELTEKVEVLTDALADRIAPRQPAPGVDLGGTK